MRFLSLCSIVFHARSICRLYVSQSNNKLNVVADNRHRSTSSMYLYLYVAYSSTRTLLILVGMKRLRGVLEFNSVQVSVENAGNESQGPATFSLSNTHKYR